MSNWQGQGGQLGRVEVIRKTPSPSPWQIAAHCLQLVEQSLGETNGPMSTLDKKASAKALLQPEAEKASTDRFQRPTSGLYP